MALLDLANPTRFMAFAARVTPWLAAASAAFLLYAAYLAFASAPEDYQQGATVRIMFVHVPTAWLGMACYSLMAASSLGTLVWRHPLADVSAKAAAPLGVAFTFICLVTGSLWGKPTWGTWWIWDARLTSMLVLLLMYLGLNALWRSVEDPGRAGRVAAVLTLVGFVNIPVIKFSVDWWNTLHQPASVFRLDGPTIHPSLLTPLIVAAVGFTLLFVTLHMAAMVNEILRRRVRAMRLVEAQRDSLPAGAQLMPAGE